MKVWRHGQIVWEGMQEGWLFGGNRSVQCVSGEDNRLASLGRLLLLLSGNNNA